MDSDAEPRMQAPDRATCEQLLEQRSDHFPAPIEQTFQLYYLRGERLRTRIGIITGLALFIGYAIWDVLSFPPEMSRWSVPLRLFVVCPIYLAVLFASHFRERVVLMDRLRLSALLTSGLCICLITVAGEKHGIDTGGEGIFLVIIASYTVTGLRTRPAAFGGLAMIPMLIACAILLDAWSHLTDAAVFACTANLIGIVASATHERAARENFLRTQILHHVAAEDSLTGLANRRFADDHLGHLVKLASRSGLRLSIAMIDVDHFKKLNDSQGHPAGDACLVRIAGALRELARRPLDLAARVGGEEFLLVWFDVSPGSSESMAKQVQEAVVRLAMEHPATAEGIVTVSAGIVNLAPTSEHSTREILVYSDEALYEAKAAGRNRSRIREF